jgi:RNA polymerase sigma-70 factor (ECF subfamily)
MKLSREQFEKLALEQLDTVYRVARRLAPDRAEDLVQETYLRALRSRDGFDLQEYGIRPWLLRILYNLHLSRGEREGRQPLRIEDEQLESAVDRTISPLPIDLHSPESMDQRLVKALDGLGEEYRTALVLWAVEDLSYKEIAHALDVPIGTVMSRLHRARQKLSEQLKDMAAEEGIIRE